MRLPRSHISAEFARLNERGRAFKAAEKKLEHVAVCLVGPKDPVPRYFGDNRGGRPCKIVVTKNDPKDAAKLTDLEAPYHEYATQELVYVPSKAHGDRLKAAMDLCLLGEQGNLGDACKPRRSFRDLYGCFDDPDTRAMWWSIMLDAALRELRKDGEFDVFGEEGRVAKVQRKAGVKSKR